MYPSSHTSVVLRLYQKNRIKIWKYHVSLEVGLNNCGAWDEKVRIVAISFLFGFFVTIINKGRRYCTFRGIGFAASSQQRTSNSCIQSYLLIKNWDVGFVPLYIPVQIYITTAVSGFMLRDVGRYGSRRAYA